MALAGCLMAQTDQGGWVLGGSSNLGFTTGKANNDQSDALSNFALDVQGGYFLMDNLAAGLLIGLSTSSIGGASSTAFGVGPFVRYYAPFKVFGQLSYQFGGAKIDDGISDLSTSVGAFGIGVGYAAFLNDHVAIEPMVGYSLLSSKLDVDGAESVAGSELGIAIGISVYLGN